MPLVEAELHRLAHYYMSRERAGHTLQTTALVDEAYLRLVGQKNIDWHNRAHFFGIAAKLMRQILVDYARKRNAGVILRGIRAISDYEYELQMALMNRKLEPRLETVFMLPGEPYSYLSSKLVREIAQHGGSLEGLVPAIVEQRLRAKVS